VIAWEAPFAQRAREVSSPERRLARAAFQEARFGPGAKLPVIGVPGSDEGIPYDPRQVWADLAANPPGDYHDFSRRVGYDAMTGQEKFATDMNALGDFLAERKAAQVAELADVATWGPGEGGRTVPTNDLAAQIEQAQRQRYEAAQLRQQAARLAADPLLRTIG